MNKVTIKNAPWVAINDWKMIEYFAKTSCWEQRATGNITNISFIANYENHMMDDDVGDE